MFHGDSYCCLVFTNVNIYAFVLKTGVAWKNPIQKSVYKSSRNIIFNSRYFKARRAPQGWIEFHIFQVDSDPMPSVTMRCINICLSLFAIDFIQSSAPFERGARYSWGPFHGQIMNIESIVSHLRIHRPFIQSIPFNNCVVFFFLKKTDFYCFYFDEICSRQLCRALYFELTKVFHWYRCIDEIDRTMAKMQHLRIVDRFDMRYTLGASEPEWNTGSKLGIMHIAHD